MLFQRLFRFGRILPFWTCPKRSRVLITRNKKVAGFRRRPKSREETPKEGCSKAAILNLGCAAQDGKN